LVTPLPARFHPAQAPGHALIALRRDTDDPAFSTSLLRALFGLSPAQAAVALGLYADKSFDEIAAERGIQVSTVRTHYEQVLARTRASGLRDLVRLLGALPPVR
jgi:DNA-binding CsgD family transcriptional regulator